MKGKHSSAVDILINKRYEDDQCLCGALQFIKSVHVWYLTVARGLDKVAVSMLWMRALGSLMFDNLPNSIQPGGCLTSNPMNSHLCPSAFLSFADIIRHNPSLRKSKIFFPKFQVHSQ